MISPNYDIILFVCLFIYISVVCGEIDTDCLWFLDDPATSPFVYMERFQPQNPASRNLTKDELAEANCEKMLKRPGLSLKNKRIIYEGLSLLSIIHVNSGVSRHMDALKHLKNLAKFDPEDYDYQARTGIWSMQLNVSSFKDAIYFLQSALYGKAASNVTRQDTYQLQRNYATALGYLGKSEAQSEWFKILSNNPLDFEVSFLLKESLKLASFKNTSSFSITKLNNILNRTESLYHIVLSYASSSNNSYTGYTSKRIEVMSIMPSTEDFNEYISERQPLVLSPSKMNDNWESWKMEHFEFNTMIQAAGHEQLEVYSRPIRSGGLLGFGIDTYKKTMTFKSFVQGRYAKLSKGNNKVSDKTSEEKGVRSYEEFLAFQPRTSGNHTLRSPMHKLVPELSQPLMLRDLHGKQKAEAHLFMGNSRSSNGTDTRIAFEVFDFLFMNVEGDCSFHLTSPKFALSMKTILPIFHVHKNGVPVTYDPISTGNKAGTVSSDQYSTAVSMDDPVLGDAAGQHSIVHLKSGDMLFVPAGWFYQMRLPEGQHTGVIFSWRPPGLKAGHKDVDTKRGLIAKALATAELEVRQSERESVQDATDGIVPADPASVSMATDNATGRNGNDVGDAVAVVVDTAGEAALEVTDLPAGAMVLRTGTSLSFCAKSPSQLFSPSKPEQPEGSECVPLTLTITDEGKVTVSKSAGGVQLYWEEDLRPLWARLGKPRVGKGPVLVYRIDSANKIELYKPKTDGSSKAGHLKPWKVLFVDSAVSVSSHSSL